MEDYEKRRSELRVACSLFFRKAKLTIISDIPKLNVQNQMFLIITFIGLV